MARTVLSAKKDLGCTCGCYPAGLHHCALEPPREHPDLSLGVSPRGSLALLKGAQALAAIRGRDYVMPEDIKTLVPLNLAHRLILTPEAELRGRTAQLILEGVLEKTPLDLGEVKS